MNEKFCSNLIQQSPMGYAYHKIICSEAGVPEDYEFIEVNRAFEKLTGLNGNDIIGKRVTQIFPGFRETDFDWVDYYGQIALLGGEKEFEQYSEHLKKYYRVNVYSPETYYFVTQFIDVTEEKVMTNAHRDRNLYLETVLETTPDGFWVIDCHKNIIQANDAYCRMSGFTRQELQLMQVNDIDAAEDLEYTMARMKRIKKFGGETFQTRHKRKDGSVFDVEISTSFLDIEGGQYVCFCRDVTEKKKAEERLRESEKNLIRSQGISHVGSWSMNVVTNEVFWSEELYKMYGFDPAFPPPPYTEHMKLFTPESWEKLSLSLEETRRSGVPYELELETVTAEGNNGWMWVRGEAVRSSGGEITGLWGAAQDITKGKQQQKAIYNEKELFKTTLLSVGDGVVSVDRLGKVRLINKAAEEMTGWSQVDCLGKPVQEILMIVMDTSLEKHLISRNGDKIPIESITTPIKDEQGFVNGEVTVLRDITEKKNKQEEIQRLSYRDQLTGLYNRRFYEEELKRLDSERNFPFTLVIGDVNGLKLVNDSFGHATGDELLKKVGEAIGRSCRSDDIIARLGGDEFVILLPKTGGDEAERIIKRINALLSQEKIGAIGISVSFGYDTKNSESQKIEEIFKSAEDSMYNHKILESPSMRGRTIDTIINTLYEKNKREEQHSRRVGAICENLARSLELSEFKVSQLRTAGRLHDIGKIAIEESILSKPGKLLNEEMAEIRRHSEIGFRILNTVNEMAEIADYVLAHHERWDGTGYPRGLRGESIPFESRIIAIADAYDAMTTKRVYSDAISIDAAILELEDNAGTQFDPKLVRIFLSQGLYKL